MTFDQKIAAFIKANNFISKKSMKNVGDGTLDDVLVHWECLNYLQFLEFPYDLHLVTDYTDLGLRYFICDNSGNYIELMTSREYRDLIEYFEKLDCLVNA